MNSINMNADSSSSAAPQPPWVELPRDVTSNILGRLGPVEVLQSAQKVCTTWWRVCCEPSFGRVIHIKKPTQIYSPYEEHTVCRRAVHLSHGELIDISVDYLCTDGLLQFISDRSSNLKRLRLERCGSISADGLISALKNFPLLEELHLFLMPSIYAMDIEIIGVSCPMLVSFTFNSRVYKNLLRIADDSHALSIAESMPNLLHLSLIGNKLSNEGLEAILDGCKNLKSLDIRRCICVDLQCELGRRCSEQIKDLRRPLDSTDDYEVDCYSSSEEDRNGEYYYYNEYDESCDGYEDLGFFGEDYF